MLIVDARQCDLVESIDADDEVEMLPDRQKIRGQQQLLWLFVPLMAQTERDQVTTLEEGAFLQTAQESIRAQLAEPVPDGTAENTDDELIGVRPGERVVVRGRKAKVVRFDAWK